MDATATSPAATASPVETLPSAAIHDTIMINRSRPPLTLDAMADIPQDFQATPVEERRRRLRILPGDLAAEATGALGQISAYGADMQADLGDLAPPWSEAAPIAERYASLLRTRDRLDALTQYNDELLAIATHDMVKYLDDANAEFEHRLARRPQLAQRYSKLAAYFEAKGRAISEGIARAKSEADRPK